MNIIKLNSARNCFRYLIKSLRIKEVYIPYYICSCIRHVAFEEGCKINYYHINLDFSPACIFPKNAYILYPNYFGICSKIVENLVEIYPNLIVDNSHSYYSKHSGIASFNSLRKFFPQIRDGGFLYTLKKFSLNIDIDNYSYTPKILDYAEICKNESRIDKLDMKFMSETTSNLVEKIDFRAESAHRKIVFNNLRKIYDGTNCLNININACDIPFCYPYLAKSEEDADKLVNELKSKNIIIYRYWDNLPSSYVENKFYKCLVAIPI